MPTYLGARELAQHVYEQTGTLLAPTAYSQAFYRQQIPPNLIATVAGRKVVDEQHLDAVIDALADRGVIRREAEVPS